MTKQLRRGGEGMNLVGADAEDVRKATATQRAALMRRVVACETQASALKAELAAQRARLEADYRRRAAELEEAMAPVRAELARAQEVLYTVDLYLGRQEHMELLRDGEPAAATEPITVRQRVLAADEESLVLLGNGGVDARSMDAFTDWIAASIENTSRLLPEPRGVVAVVPSRQDRDVGDPWLNAQLGAANRQTYWLFRNGERLWMMVTDFIAGPVILPRRDEFLDFFAVRDWRGAKTGETIAPGSEQWLEAEQRADARKRHFMRIGMILQGVIDRTTVFQPLPTQGINLLTAAQAELQQVRFLNELDLALEDGRPSFREWQCRLNSQLTVGMRIIGAFDSNDFHREYVKGDRWHRGYHPRLHPGNASYPRATPRPGLPRPSATTFADVDLASLQQRLGTLSESVPSDPAELRALVARLERELSVERSKPMPPPLRVEVPVLSDKDRILLSSVAGTLSEILHRVADTPPASPQRISMGRLDEQAAMMMWGLPDPQPSDVESTSPATAARRGRRTTASRRPPESTEPSDTASGSLPKAQRLIVSALALHGPLNPVQIAVLTGYRSTSGGFRNALSNLRSAGLIEGRGVLTLTAAASTEGLDPLPAPGPDLIEWWKRHHLNKAERAIIDALVEAAPNPLPNDEIAARTGYSATSGGFRNALSRLRTMQLAEGRGQLSLSPTVYPS